MFTINAIQSDARDKVRWDNVIIRGREGQSEDILDWDRDYCSGT